MTINKPYRREVEAARRLARWADGHSLLLNVLTTAEAAAFLIYVFMNC